MNRFQRVLPVLIVPMAAALLCAAAAPTAPPPLPTGPAPDLNLVFTAQVIGWVEPCG